MRTFSWLPAALCLGLATSSGSLARAEPHGSLAWKTVEERARHDFRPAPAAKALVETLEEHDPADVVEALALERPGAATGRDELIAALLAWHRAGAGIGVELCEELPAPLRILSLARLALQAGDEKAVEPVLALGQALRRQGGFLHYMIGLRIADEALRAADRKALVPPLLRQRAPTLEELENALAREAVCSRALLESAKTTAEARAALVADFESFWLGALTGALAAKDIVGVESAISRLRVSPDEVRRRPALVAVVDLSGQMDECGKVLALWDEALAGHLPERASRAAAGGTELPANPPKPCPVSGIVKSRQGDVVVLSGPLTERFLADFDACAGSSVRAVPRFVDGVARGFKVFKIVPGSIAEELGFRDGDVIERVNGSPLNDPAKALDIYEAMKREKKLTVLLEREGAQRTLTFVKGD